MNRRQNIRIKEGESMPARILLEIQDLNIYFTQYDRGLRQKELHPIKGLSCQIRERELTAIVGASGSGKSLLAHAVLGILPYNCKVKGRIQYQGSELTGKRLKLLRGNEITLIPQGVSYLDPLMKVGDLIRKGRRDQASRDRCRSLLARYGLEPQTEELYPFELSGGMARRVLIAAALMEEPKLVIADEPTPGLDLKTARRVAGHLKEIADDGAAVLLITHDLELALETADRILVFYEGRILEETDASAFKDGTALKEPYTKALYRAMPEHGFQVWEGMK